MTEPEVRRVRTWNVSLYNAYNAMNPTFVYEDADPGRNNEFKRVIKKYTLFPLIPSFTYTYKF